MIKLQGISKSYGDNTILKDVHYTFPEHGFVCLLGPSGCGKTTLFNLLAGFDKDYEGQLLVNREDLHALSTQALCQYRKDTIGFVFQNYHLLPGYTVYENILLASSQDDVTKEELNEHIVKLIEKVGLSDKTHELIEHLSGGQKQRVAIVRALINQPSIILADEPTGALDHENALAIMALLKEISKDHLVLMITHDASLCDDVDEVLRIQNQIIVSNTPPHSVKTLEKSKINNVVKKASLHTACKNFRTHLTTYLMVALAIAVGATIFILSLSSSNLLQGSIQDFKEKNTAFNNGQIKEEENIDEVFETLQKDERLAHVYKQYVLQEVSLSLNDQSVVMLEKYPMSKSLERMSYGVMPRSGKNEISLSPSLAKKFGKNLGELIGEKLQFTYQDQVYEVEVSGIFGASYDDFYVSSDMEELLYQGMEDASAFAISFEVKDFADIVSVYEQLQAQSLDITMADKEVGALQSTFTNLQTLFYVVSFFILCVASLLSTVMLVKVQRTRLREVGLLSALGYQKRQIQTMFLKEHFLLVILATGLNALCLGLVYVICTQASIPLTITWIQVILSFVATSVLVMIISIIAAYPCLKVEPAKALRS